ncbi:hypothetical protein C2U36_27495, partial [Escherichia coli]
KYLHEKLPNKAKLGLYFNPYGKVLVADRRTVSPIKYLHEKLPNKAKLGLYFNPYGKVLVADRRTVSP